MSVNVGTTSQGLWGEAGPNSVLALLAGPLRSIVEQVWPGEAALHYLSASDRRRQVWNACVAQRQFVLQPREHALWRELLLRSDRWLLKEAFGEPRPGAARALGKLGAAAVHPEVYAALMTILRDGGLGAKLLRHSKLLTTSLLLIAVELPAELRTAQVVDACETRVAFAREIAWHYRRLEQLAGSSGARDAARSLRKFTSRTRICAAIRTDERLKRPTLPAPYPGEGLMRPLVTVADVAENGKRFRNCVADGGYVQDGLAAIYVWEGDEPAMIELHRHEPLGWRVVQISGIGNAPVSKQTWAAIEAWFGANPDVHISGEASLRHWLGPAWWRLETPEWHEVIVEQIA